MENVVANIPITDLFRAAFRNQLQEVQVAWGDGGWQLNDLPDHIGFRVFFADIESGIPWFVRATFNHILIHTFQLMDCRINLDDESENYQSVFLLYGSTKLASVGGIRRE